MEAATLVGLIASVLLLILIGLALRLLKVLTREDADVLNKIIVYLALPALIFTAIRQSEPTFALLLIPLLGWLIILAGFGVAFAAGRLMRLERRTFGGFLLVSALGNTGYLGYPLALAIFGQRQLVKAVFYDVFGTALALLTLGVYLATVYGEPAGGETRRLVEIVTFPPLVAVALGFVLRPVPLPGFLLQVLDYLAGATVPLIMVAIGLSLRPGHIVEYKLPIAVTGIIKLGLAPLLALVAARLAGLPAVDAGILILQASMPVMTLSFVIGQRHRLNTDFIPAAIFVTTAAAALTIPLWQLLA
ncbi:MAG: AEC family transporter [Actinobacteria bacterium]|nr:MAG: AEC family transporter [Actinomycetota bacterium]